MMERHEEFNIALGAFAGSPASSGSAPTEASGRRRGGGMITKVAGIKVGHWTDRQGLTGCTVVLCPPGTVGSGEVRAAPRGP